jgi:hypothetical protein
MLAARNKKAFNNDEPVWINPTVTRSGKYHFYLDISNFFSCYVNVCCLTLKTTNGLHNISKNSKSSASCY